MEVTTSSGRKSLPVLHAERKPAVYWYLSMRCNLACKHCWVNSSPNVDTSGDLSISEMLDAVDNIAELNPNTVLLTGGEPLFHPGIVPILTALGEKRVPIGIETNAMLISDEIRDVVTGIRADGGEVGFSVSLDGGDAASHDWCRGKGSFDKTVEGLRRLQEMGIAAEVQCVINQRNIDTLADLVRLVTPLGISYLKFVVTNPVGRATKFTKSLEVPFDQTHDALRELADAIDQYPGDVIIKVPPAMIPPALQNRLRHYTSPSGCVVKNITSCSFPLLGVLPDGSVTICAASGDVEDVHFGDIRTLSLAELWKRPYFGQLREDYLNSELNGICSDCIFKQECRGACRAYALEESGSLQDPYPVCAEMERQGHFPDAYRISSLKRMEDRAKELIGRA